ncbi:MAG: ADP-ribosylglycohydrolase family protein [Steroidobacteraceae bacterium]|nr:ADP-ribosylglycohydrolase family protein [Steroidobacteraceae bacterium]
MRTRDVGIANVADRARPHPNCYWVVPGKLLAGEHPAGVTLEETQQRLQDLLAAGIDCFIDLTMPGEMPAYDVDLPMSVEYIRKPIRDHGIPARREHMLDIQACLHEALRSGRRAYVHCRAGIGRTGTVIGCFLVEQGLSGREALERLNTLWQQCDRAHTWPKVPETDDQCDFVRNWKPQLATLMPTLGTPEKDPLFDTSTLAVARHVRERFLGALIGLAVGDALAAATQYRKPGTFTPIGDLLGGGPFDLPRGAWSDDTAMALCLAESLVERGVFDPRDQVERYTMWQQQGHLSATGQCVGITASTARALGMAKWRRQLYSGSHDPAQLDPEVLSRVAPVVMFFFATPAEAVAHAGEAARVTCQAPGALEACRFFGAVLHGALSGKAKKALLTPAGDLLDITSLRTGVAQVASTAASAAVIASPRAGNVIEVLEAALWAFRSTDNFRDGALRAANLGGNADVAAAVYGQLAGAHYGVSAIPGTWRNSLLRADLIETLADRLLAQAMVALSG